MNLLLYFCTILGIIDRLLGFIELQLYTGMLVAMLQQGQLLLLEATFKGQIRNIDEVSIEAILQLYDEYVQQIYIGLYTIISTIISQIVYGKGCYNKMGGQRTIYQAEEEVVLFYSSEWIIVDNFQRMLYNIVVKANSLLD